jgi:branched-subunit amino acid aminotransferase/4-amino-4-deoxychorismate lyase
MEKRQYIWLNGEFFRDDHPVLNINNRAFAYGDGFFETIHAYGTEAKHLHLHFARITKSLQILGMLRPPFLNQEFITNEITRLLNKNRIFGSARIRLSVFRNPGGFYAPKDNTVSLAMQSIPLTQDFYPLNSKGLVIDVYTHIRKPINLLSPLKSCNAQLYVMAGIFKEQNKLDDCLLINDQNRIVEAISSNVFLVMGNVIYTPSLAEGCVAGVMREVVIDLARKKGYTVKYDSIIEPEMLLDSDELFLTNAVSGIKWVVGLHQKRYFGLVGKKLSGVLNELTFSSKP